jgi:hypothetical protein
MPQKGTKSTKRVPTEIIIVSSGLSYFCAFCAFLWLTFVAQTTSAKLLRVRANHQYPKMKITRAIAVK